VEHKTGHLIFEYNRFKDVDKEAFGEYEDLLVEILSRKKINSGLLLFYFKTASADIAFIN